MEDYLEQQLYSLVADRLANTYQKDEEYQKLLKEEQLIYEKLCKKLSNEDAAELQKYFMAATSTAAKKENLAYERGMRDLFALFKYLSK
jgi:hypothetical protein